MVHSVCVTELGLSVCKWQAMHFITNPSYASACDWGEYGRVIIDPQNNLLSASFVEFVLIFPQSVIQL